MDLHEQLQQTLGGAYTIDYELKGGGMAHVFLAEETALGRKVVVKVLATEIGQALSAERFAREVKLVASLQHPNIVPLLQAGHARDLVYYTMPFIKGDSLRARLRQTGRLETGEAISILRDVACALEFAHGEGIVHRDIKPENILLAGAAAVVTDFGIAKALSASRRADLAAPVTSDPSFSLTEMGMTPGTPAYAAPEQVAGESVDYRADIYSWGVVAYELLAGAHPFEGKKTAHQLLAAQISERPAPLEQRVRGLPTALTEMVMRSLEKDPANRPQTARELVDAISRGGAVAVKTSYPGSSRSLIRYGVPLATVLLLVALYLGRGRIIASTPGDQARSLAVLPFSNVGGDTSNAYFADGIANELTSELTKVPGLRVASRTSAFAMRSRADLDVREIGKRLGVGTVLEGTVQRSSGKLRVSAQLTNAADGLTLWSDSYERENTEIFAVQDDIARAIIGALRPRLTAGGGQPVNPGTEGPGTKNLEAYDLYLRGLYLVERRGPGVAQSAAYFSQAIAKDTAFAKAYAALSTALALSQYFTPTPAYSVEGKTIAAANHALAIDPKLAEPHAALALSHMHALRWDLAEQEFKRAIEIDSASPTSRTQYGRYLVLVGRIPEAVEQFRIARRLDPLAATASVWLSHTLFMAGQRDEALAESKRALELDPQLATARVFLGMDRAAEGKGEEARAIVVSALSETPWNGMSGYVLGQLGDTTAARAVLKKLDALPRNTWMINTARAYIYLGLGEADLALASLEAAIAARETTSSWIPFPDRAYDLVRASPRFAAIVRASGLENRGLTSGNGGRPAP